MPSYTKTIGGQSVTWSGGGGSRETADGTLLIEAAHANGPVTNPTVSLYSPAYTPGTAGAWRNGAILNPAGNLQHHQIGLDSRMAAPGLPFPGSTPLPCTLSAGDVLVIAKSAPEAASWTLPGPKWPVASYHGDGSRSYIANMLVVIAVPYNPATTEIDAVTYGPDLLAPPAIGNNSLVRSWRGAPLSELRIDMTQLPNTIDLGHATFSGITPPTTAAMTAMFAGCGGELFDGWNTDRYTPGWEHPGYGSNFAGFISNALVVACSNRSNAEKYPLVRNLVQWGVHQAGAFADGRVTHNFGGGHAQGRKALVIFAGHMLNLPWLADPDAFFGPLSPTQTQFEETMRHFQIAWWFVNPAAPVATDMTMGWRMTGINAGPQGNGSLLAVPPSVATWGDVNDHSSMAFGMQGYFAQTIGANIGTALAMQLMGQEATPPPVGASLLNNWNPRIRQMIRHYIAGPPGGAGGAANTALTAIGVGIPWGDDYSIGPCVPTFCRRAWNQYAV